MEETTPNGLACNLLCNIFSVLVVEPELTCHEPLDIGHGGGRFKRFFFNATLKTCERFIYQGLGGNGNRYESKADCLQACSSKFRFCAS